MSTNFTGNEPIVPSNKEMALAEKSSRILSDYIKSTKKPTLQFINSKKQNKKIELPPVLITPENYKSPEVQKLLQTPEKF